MRCLKLWEWNSLDRIIIISSHIAIGSYEMEDIYLILNIDDGKYNYVFKIENNALIIDADKSSKIPSFANINDGAVFR
jgi:hypothetical protein